MALTDAERITVFITLFTRAKQGLPRLTAAAARAAARMGGAADATGARMMTGMDPHPDLRLRCFPGRFEVWLSNWAQPIARGQELHDGTWVVAVRPLQNGPERSTIVDSESAALVRIQPWCRKIAWKYRPNVRNVPGAHGMGSPIPGGDE